MRALALLLVVVTAACSRCSGVSGTAAVADNGADAGTGAPRLDTDSTRSADLVAAYDVATPADPRAAALCDALHGLPASRKATCCQEAVPAAAAATCTGALSAALLAKDVVVEARSPGSRDGAVAGCAAARAQQLDGCAWVSALSPTAPAACAGLVRGTLGEGARCRSSLACQDGLRCHGSSTLDPGRCGPPLADGQRCGSSVDALAIVTGQLEIERTHRSCKGRCMLGRCAATGVVGNACRADDDCGDGNRCANQVCVAGRIAVGSACTAGGCVDGARCQAGTCRVLAAAGGSCANDFDCAIGGCAKAPGATAGSCGMRCPSWRDVQPKQPKQAR